MKKTKIIPFPLRISANLKGWLKSTAESNKRSMNSELIVLIEKAKEAMENKEREAEKPV